MKRNLPQFLTTRPRITPTVKLTISYLALLMALSLILTIPLYRSSTGAADRGLRSERLYFEGANPYSIGPNYQQIELGQVTGFHKHLLNELITLNLLVLLIGGGLSFYLARRTLSPIEAALAAQSRFAADASHELRTPLTAMKSEIEVSLRDPHLPIAGARELLKSNLEEVAKLEALAGGLLRLARHGNERLPLSPVDLSEISAKAISRLSVAAEQQHVSINMADVSGTVLADPDALLELTVILLDNAIKYSSAASEVKLYAKRHGAIIDFTVKDTGTGIAASDLPHIFDRFYRADTSRSKVTPGYGLGLSIAARIAELHGASIDATSKLGAGSHFTIHLRAAGTQPKALPAKV
ncbi:HAMP domain-containing histidine kinase [Candidatus Saccharibacteria bacterium]|nr:HAMP domain-containing histidine kinase [Candidatus Saccharibacteria bacterium]